MFTLNFISGFRLAGRIRTSTPMVVTNSTLWCMPVPGKTFWSPRASPISSIFSVCTRQLFTSYKSRISHQTATGLFCTMGANDLKSTLSRKLPGVNPCRNINTCSKLGKRKTCKAVAKRFLRTGKGKLKRWRAGKSHNMMSKGKKRSRQLRKPTCVSKQQLKLLNKMLNGW